MKATYEIHSEARGGHWVAWATRHAEAKPAGAAILVGQTQQEAEANAALWVDRLDADPNLLRSEARVHLPVEATTPGEFSGPAGLGRIDGPARGALRRREVLVARRKLTIQKHVRTAETALARGAHGAALSAAEQAGLLDPDNAQVLAILEKAQSSAVSSPAGRQERSRPAGGVVGPASWSIGTPFAGTPRSAASAVSVAVSIAGHVVIALVAVIAFISVAPVVEVTPLMRLAFMPAGALPPDPPGPDVPPEEQVYEEVEPPTPVMATRTLSQIPLDVAPIRRRAATSSTALRRPRSTRRGGLSRANALSGRGPWEGAEGDRPPILVRAVPPLYPRTAFDQGFEGIVVVILEVLLNNEGVVERTSIVEGLPLLNQAARDAVQKWEYRPAFRNGFTVPSIFTVSITFDFR